MKKLTMTAVIIKNALGNRVQRIARVQVNTNRMPCSVLFLQRHQRILCVETAVLSKCFRNDEHGIGKNLHPEFRLAFDGILELHQSVVESDLKGAS